MAQIDVYAVFPCGGIFGYVFKGNTVDSGRSTHLRGEKNLLGHGVWPIAVYRNPLMSDVVVAYLYIASCQTNG